MHSKQCFESKCAILEAILPEKQYISSTFPLHPRRGKRTHQSEGGGRFTHASEMSGQGEKGRESEEG